MYDLLIKGGTVIDGTGGPAQNADVAVSNGRIAAIRPEIDPGLAGQVIDARGMMVSPGFIDIHSHSDANFLHDDRCEAKIYQGVTTELMGQCGSSLYPCPQEHPQRIREYCGRSAGDFASLSLAEFAEKVQAQGKRMGTNLLPLTGHGALRCGVMGYENRFASEAEIAQMRRLLKADMETGAWGLSLGLGYTPGVSSEIEELCALGEIVAPYDGIITSHMRNQGTDTPKSLEEMYTINRRTGAHVHIAHFKASGKPSWGRAPEFSENVRRARESGVNVTVDVYPYPASSSGITNSFPQWSIQGGRARALQALRGDERQKIMDHLEKTFATEDDGERLLVVTTNGHLPEADGKTIQQLSSMWGISRAEAAAKVADDTNAQTVCIAFVMSDEDVMHMLSQNEYAIGSDGRAYPFDPALNDGKPHPRSFGTFPRFLKIVRETGLCSRETAVRRFTGLSADFLGITDRGYLRPNAIADITVFDWNTIADRATFENPFQKPVGVHHVVMGGKLAVSNGVQTDLRLGSLIMKK